MKFFFCYEKVLGKWSPVLYHHNEPQWKDGYIMSLNGQQQPATRPVAVEAEQEPTFASLMKRYPPPHEEQKMVRPIEGFRTKDGKFFENEDDATLHEVVSDLTNNLREYMGEDMTANLPGEVQDEVILNILRFIGENKDHVSRYIDVIRRKDAAVIEPPNDPEPATTMDGPTAETVS